MADPNRKINLEFPSDDDSSDDKSDEAQTFSPSEISLVKEFEEEFKNRFTDEDEEFSAFCKQKQKPPPIVFPFDSFNHHNNRGGGRGRFQSYGNRGGFDSRRHYDNHRHDHHGQGNRNNHFNRNRDDHHQPPFKRAREDRHQDHPGSY